MYNFPYDAPNAYISDPLNFFGTIQRVRYQSWTNLPEVSTGTRVVRINLHHPIPRFLRIHTYRCKVWYRGQPMYCDICKEGTHLASICPYKEKCLSCEGVGHLARHCPTLCFKCKGDHASDSCPNRRRWERATADEDDFCSVASDLGVATDVAGDPAESTTDSAEAAGPAFAAGLAAAAGVTRNSAAGGPASSGVVLIDFLALRPPLTSTVSQPGTAPDDERFNQLNEIQMQEESLSQSVLDGLSGVVNEACEPAIDALESAGDSVSDVSLSGVPL